jgi:hypothetical protein
MANIKDIVNYEGERSEPQTLSTVNLFQEGSWYTKDGQADGSVKNGQEQ